MEEADQGRQCQIDSSKLGRTVYSIRLRRNISFLCADANNVPPLVRLTHWLDHLLDVNINTNIIYVFMTIYKIFLISIHYEAIDLLSIEDVVDVICYEEDVELVDLLLPTGKRKQVRHAVAPKLIKIRASPFTYTLPSILAMYHSKASFPIALV